jgi:N6-adenosine-specific RNA methylase IME4
MKIIINEELKALLPPLTSDEYKTLEESIIENGCREPLIVWNDILIDGHNRFEICSKHNIDYQIKEIHAENIDEVKVWIIDNQKGRRNLTDGWKFELAQVKKEILLKQGREKQKETLMRGNSAPVLSIIDKTEHNTRDEIASELGWSTGKVAIADKVWKEAKPEIKEKIKNGEVTFNQAYTDIKREKKKEEIKQKQIEQSKNYKNVKMPDKIYRIIYADPPWKYNDKQEISSLGGAGKHYLTMTINEICNMKLPKINDDAVLFLWVTAPLLEDVFKIINAWGFKYKAQFIWDKIQHNMGHYNSVRHEILLICTKGSCTPDNKKLYDSVQSIKKTEHSRKPDEFRNIIDTLYPYGNRIELFARTKTENWDAWGNEL